LIELCVAWLGLLVFVGGCCEVFAVVWKGEDVFVVGEVFTGVATQGGSIEEAVKNLRARAYLKEFPELGEEIGGLGLVGLIYVEVAKAVG